MPDYRLARSLETLRAQVNAKWPNRSRESDGWIGDTSHSARKSDHNPDSNGIVHAIDITHDPKFGFDSYAFADHILQQQDARLSYVISNGRIGSGPAGVQPGIWRKYSGTNKHDHHCHISCRGSAFADDKRAWDIGVAILPNKDVANAYVAPLPTMRLGSRSEYVKLLQSKLGFKVDDIDSVFGPKTEAALKKFQANHGLVVDGICGPQCWKLLNS